MSGQHIDANSEQLQESSNSDHAQDPPQASRDIGEFKHDSDKSSNCTDLDIDEMMESSDTEASGSSVEGDWEDENFITEEVWTIEHQYVGFPAYNNTDQCNIPEGATTPYDFYKIFFTQDFLIDIMNSTNENAAALVAAGDENVCGWGELTISEFETFLGTLFLMGSMRMEIIAEYWDMDPEWINFYPRHFITKERFLAIFRCLKFGRDDTNGLISYFNKKMTSIFTPGVDLTIDSHDIAYNRRHKFKLHRLATASGIILKLVKNKHADEEENKQLVRNEIVKELLQEYLNTGRHLYMDRYYTNLNLATWLVKNKTNITGTLYPRRESEPRVVVAAKLKNKGLIHRYSSSGICICKWRDHEDMLALSSVFSPARLPKTRHGVTVFGYPDMSIKYHETMMKLDTYDLLMDYYILQFKWMAKDKKIGLHILQIMLLNCFLLYKLEKNRPRLSYHKFRNSIFTSFLPMHLIPLNQPDDCVEAA